MRIDHLAVGKRLSIGFGVSLLFLILVAGLGIRGLHEANQTLKHMADVNTVKLELLSEMSESSDIVARVIRTVALLHDSAEIERQSAKINGERIIYNKAFEALQKMPLNDAGKAFVEKIKVAAAPARAINNKFLELNKTNPEEAVKLLITESIPLNATWQNAIHEFSDLQKAKNHQDEEAAAADYQSTLTAMLVFALVAVLSCIGLAMVIARSILGQLGGEPNYAATIANGIAQGDLTAQIITRPGDQSSLMVAIRTMRDSLEQIVVQVRSGTETITVASGEISAGNMDLSSRTELQASSLEETSASLEELTSTVKNNADNATRASKLAVEASKQAEQGGQAVGQVVNTMSSINESSKKIVDIIGVIDGIAFQTNILALNAAVEAARAGEQGRGFAVVASEVRNLAQRSAAAAKEIKTLIGDSVDKVAAGTKQVDEAGKTMQEVVASVRRVSDIISEIAEASREQTSGIEQINEAVSQMDEVTQQNAALVEEAAAAAQSMQDQAGVLTEVVNIFRLNAQDSGSHRVLSEKNRVVPAAARLAPAAKKKPAMLRAVSKPNPAPQIDNKDWEEF